MKKIKPLLFVVVVLMIAALLAPAALAQDDIPIVVTEEPIPPRWRLDGLEIPYQRVDVRIDGQVATTHIEQLFRNPTDWLLEGT